MPGSLCGQLRYVNRTQQQIMGRNMSVNKGTEADNHHQLRKSRTHHLHRLKASPSACVLTFRPWLSGSGSLAYIWMPWGMFPTQRSHSTLGHPRNKDPFILLVPPQKTFKISVYTFFTLPLSGLSNLNSFLIHPCPEIYREKHSIWL